MRRVGRWMMQGATVLSLVMCVGTVGLWVRSYYATDRVAYSPTATTETHRESLTYIVQSGRGRVGFNRTAVPGRLLPGLRASGIKYRHFESVPLPLLVPGMSARFGFEFAHLALGGGRGLVPVRVFQIVVPLWAMTLAFAALPSFWVWRWHYRRKRDSNHCDCGYDLTGNLSGICPECGTAIAPASS